MGSACYDVIVVGGGHNGLVCAAYLARAGLSTAVVEMAERPGGCIVDETPPHLPGFTLDLGGLEHGRLWGSAVVEELELARHGLRLIPREVYGAGLFEGGQALAIHRDVEATYASIARFSPADARAYRRFVAAMSGVLDLLGALNSGPPPAASTLLRLAALLPRGGRVDACLRLFLQSSRAVLDEWFESTELKAVLGSFAAHSQLPPWESGAGYMPALLTGIHRGMPARPAGGSGAFIGSLLACLRAHGGAVHTGLAVTRVVVERGRATGVVRADGSILRAQRAVISAVDARRLLLDLLEPADVPAGYRDEALRIRVATHNVGEMSMGLALSALPDFGPASRGPALTGSSFLAPSLGYLEEAFLDIARGDLPANPALMWALPTTTDPSLAPPGAHTLWMAAFVPWQLRGGHSWDDRREEAADHALAVLARHAPDLPRLVLGRVVLSPLDWSRRTGNLAGSADHVDQTLDQMLGNRPSPRLSGYRTPIGGLYLTGAGTHPGGGISGVPGRNTAREVLADLAAGNWCTASRRAGHLAARGYTALRGWRALESLARAATHGSPGGSVHG